jgi:2-keto-4-pentenoate hydratase
MSLAVADTIHEVADRLRTARASRQPIAPVRHDLPAKDIEAAYAVQRINVARLEAEGRRRVGRKIGLTSQAVQTQLGVDQPDFGVLFDFMDYGREPIPVSSLVSPRIEAEFALRIGRDITLAGLSVGDLAGHVESVAVSAEIVDSAIASWDIDIVDTVADNASCGGFVVGEWQRYTAGLKLPERRMRLTRNGEEISVGVGAATLGDPLKALAWLADASIARGDPLRAGEIVLSGALGPMKPLTPGDYRIEIEGFPALLVRAGP